MNLAFLQSKQGDDPIVVEGVFKTTAERLFRAWTSPDEVKKWFGANDSGPKKATIDLRLGGKWRFVYPGDDGQTDTLIGEYVDITPSERLIFTWQHERLLPDGKITKSPSSLVTISFTETSDGVHLHLLHERIALNDGREGVGKGWEMSFHKLKSLTEQP